MSEDRTLVEKLDNFWGTHGLVLVFAVAIEMWSKGR